MTKSENKENASFTDIETGEHINADQDEKYSNYKKQIDLISTAVIFTGIGITCFVLSSFANKNDRAIETSYEAIAGAVSFFIAGYTAVDCIDRINNAHYYR